MAIQTIHACDRCGYKWEDHQIYSVQVDTYLLETEFGLTSHQADLCELCVDDEVTSLASSPFFKGRRLRLVPKRG